MKLPIPPRFSDPTLEQHFLRIQQELEQASSRTWYLDRDVEHPHSLTVRGNLQLSDTTAVTEILDEDNFSSDSATALATQQSIKAYVDSASSSSLDELSDVTLSSLATGDLLRYNGSGWVNATLADAGISATGHSHVIADVTGLQTALDGKASSSHTHAFSEITATPTTLAGYGITDAASSSHTHAFSEITATPTTLAGYGITDAASSSHTHAFSEITSTPTTLSGYGITDAASSSHTHALDDLSDVTITTVASGEFLKWSGSAWINSSSPSGVTQVSAGAGLTTSPDPITSTGTVSMDRFGFEDMNAPDADKVPFYDYTQGQFDWLLFDTDDFTISDTTISLAADAVGFTTAGSGLVASGTGLVQDTVSVKYTSGSNLIDGADAGSIDGADYILFQDDSDSSIVKKDTVANLPFVDAVAGTAPIASSGGTSPTISLNYTVGLKNSGSNLVVDIETNTHDFDSSAGDTMDASDIVMLFDRGSDVDRPTPSDPGAGGTYVARLDELDLNLMNNNNSNFTKNGFDTAGAGLVRLNNQPTSSTITVDYITTSNVISDAFSGTGDVVDAANDRMLIYNVAPEESGEYVQYININQLPFAQTDAIESITANWIFNADITWGDDDALQFGTSVDYWFEYNTTGTQFEFWTSDSNGSGADALLMSVSDGGTVVDFNGQVITPAIRVGGGPQASTGEVKLSYTDKIVWRNATDDADVTALTVDDTDNLLNTSTTFRPDTDSLRDLGTHEIRWRHIYVDDITVTDGFVSSVDEATNGGITVDPTSGAVLLGIRLTGTDNYILEAPDQQGVAIATSARVAYSDGSNNVQYGNVSDLPFPSKTGDETISGDWTVTGEWTFSNDLTLEATVPRLYFRESGQAADEKLYRMVVSGSNFKLQARNDADDQNTDIFEVDRGVAEAVNAVDFHVNIRPADANRYLGTSASRWDTAYIDTLVLTNDLSVEHGGTGASSFANDELLIGGGGTNAVTTDSNLSFSGGSSGQLNAPFFNGNGQYLTQVPSETVALQSLGTGTRYVLMTPDASGQAQVTVDDADLFWTISSNTLTAANLDVTGTIVNAEWQGDVIASAYLDADTAHLSGTQTFTGTKSFSDGIRANGWLHLQNETSANDPTSALAGYQTLYSYDNGSTFELRTIVSDSPNPDLVRNIPLITGSAANNQLLVSTGTDHEADWSSGPDSNELTWDGTNLNITGTGGFTGDGSGLDNVVATDLKITDVAQNAPSGSMPDGSYQVALADTLAAGDVTMFGGGNQLYYVTSTDTLTGVNATLSGDLTVTNDLDVDGTTNLDVVDIDGAVDMASTLTVAGNVDFNGDLDVDGTTNLDAVDIDGNVDMAGTLTLASTLTIDKEDATPTLNVIRSDSSIAASNLVTLLQARGDLGSGAITGATIAVRADEDWVQGSNSGTRIAFTTSTNGTWNSDTERLRIDHNGNIGIGSQNPGALLELKESSNAAGDAVIRLRGHGNNSDNTVLGALEWYNADSSGDQPGVVCRIEGVSGNANGHMGELIFKTHDGSEGGGGSDPVERMRIDNSGNVGIGTASPSYALHVIGDVVATV